ncbi:pyruvate kinase [Blastococcus sp. TF02A_35]|uniref:pyruvate kinase n=1 Tax=Blastococcus sp. TF02A-35 TaxID=2559612 RepID=UPI001430531C|nr:pyruvate kinase [Blastococcus sp. TF02A_35]
MTKIVITVGPNTSTPESWRQIIDSGADAFRFPASKFGVDVLTDQAWSVAKEADGLGAKLDLLLDLPGSKTRLTNDNGFPLDPQRPVRVAFSPEEADPRLDPPRLGISGGGLDEVAVGDVLVTGDGEEALAVEAVADDHCIARPLTSGELGRRRGVTVSGRSNASESLTAGDREGLETLGAAPFTGVIVSFVESAKTVREVKESLARSFGNRPPPAVIAKVETAAGIGAIQEILDESDGVLLGRGDLLLDVGPIEFYDACRSVLKAADKQGVPAIVGTQLLVSLSNTWLPNRSELAYVSHLIEKRVHGLMLSTETTVGKHPTRTVAMLSSLIERYGAESGRLPLFRAS